MPVGRTNRREFMTAPGGAAAWPLAARAQERVRHIGVLTGSPETDADAQANQAAFRQALAQLGWTEGRNIRSDYRWGSGGNPELRSRYVAELVALAPEVIVVQGGVSVGAMQRATHTIPIVFVGLIDPVGAGVVESLARPGGIEWGWDVCCGA